jgi:putative peptidoglycan lipid II flippase
VNILLAFPLAARFDVLGLGVAFSISYALGALVALFVLRRKVEGFPVTQLLVSLARMLIASFIMGAIVWLSLEPFGDDNGFRAIIKVAAGSIIGIIVYVGALTLLRAPEIEGLRHLRQRLRRS